MDNYFNTYVIFSSVQSYQFALSLKTIILLKTTRYNLVRKRILESPSLILDIEFLKFKTMKQIERVTDFGEYLGNVAFKELTVHVTPDFDDFNFKQYNDFFALIKTTNLTLTQTFKPMEKISFADYLHPMILCTLTTLRISTTVFKIFQTEKLPYHLLKGTWIIFIRATMITERINILHPMILLHERENNIELYVKYGNLNFLNADNASYKSQAKFLLSSKSIIRNFGDGFYRNLSTYIGGHVEAYKISEYLKKHS